MLFHPVQYLCLKIGGYNAHKRSVEILNFCLLGCLRILGGKFAFINRVDIPEGVPIIFASNHQSMMDIPPYLQWLAKVLTIAFRLLAI